MEWYYLDKEYIKNIECVNPYTDKYMIRFSPNTNFDRENKNIGDTKFILKYVNHKPTLYDIKEILLSLQLEYDNSYEVNNFHLDGYNVWLDKATRVGLFNVLNLEKQLNKDITTLWFDNKSIEINVDKAISLLTAVEVYAKQCYDNTQKHLKEISQLTTIEELLNYDITAGYPEQLNITTE